MFGRTIRTTFEEVSITATKKAKCKFCNKKIVRRKKFCQTINPFNKNSNGEIKQSSEIREELKIEKNKWLEDLNEYHQKCYEEDVL
jgi:hypothetical protein